MRQVGGWSRPWLVAMFWLGTSSPPCMPRCVCGWWGVCGWGGVSSIVQPVHTFFASQPLYDRKFPHTQNLGEVPPSSFCIFLKKQKQKHHAPPQNPPSPPPFSLSLSFPACVGVCCALPQTGRRSANRSAQGPRTLPGVGRAVRYAICG